MNDAQTVTGLKALSVRQPWAWALIHADKDIENRSAGALRHMDLRSGHRLAIHASKGMTREEYEDGADFMSEIGGACPPARDLVRGAIIGSVEIVAVVKHSDSLWFFGPGGILIRDPARPLPAETPSGCSPGRPAAHWSRRRNGCSPRCRRRRRRPSSQCCSLMRRSSDDPRRTDRA